MNLWSGDGSLAWSRTYVIGILGYQLLNLGITPTGFLCALGGKCKKVSISLFFCHLSFVFILFLWTTLVHTLTNYFLLETFSYLCSLTTVHLSSLFSSKPLYSWISLPFVPFLILLCVSIISSLCYLYAIHLQIFPIKNSIRAQELYRKYSTFTTLIKTLCGAPRFIKFDRIHDLSLSKSLYLSLLFIFSFLMNETSICWATKSETWE